jgi:hypothetical protein
MGTDTFLPAVTFDYAYGRHSWAEAHIADDINEYWFTASYVLSDPLFDLVRAITPLLRQDGTARCRWWNEPSEDRWVLRREGDALIISILWLRYFQINDYLLERSDSHGKEGFSTMCNFWKFAAKVRLSASRFIAHEKQQGRHVTWENRTEYRYLEATLEQRKQPHS